MDVTMKGNEQLCRENAKKAFCKIVIATHKECDVPIGDCYLPLHVGHEGKADIGFIGDDTGDNISVKNPYYSELTGLYWAWKNLDCEYLGLAHYRRHFSVKGWRFRRTHRPMECVLNDEEVTQLLKQSPVLVPKRRRYYIETIASHYQHSLTDGQSHLAASRCVMMEKHPDYIAAFDRVMENASAHMFNMFIMPKALANEYCEWLFDILFELENRIDSRYYSSFDKRYPGRVAEMLLDVWLGYNEISYLEIGRIDLWKVNWVKKIIGFIAAKLFGIKQAKSM